MRESAFKLDAVWHGGKRKDASARREKVARVIIGVEADEVRVEHAEKDFATDGQYPEAGWTRVIGGASTRCHARSRTDL
jgi:hypothetical protein